MDILQHRDKIENYLKKYKVGMLSSSEEKRKKSKEFYDYYYDIWLQIPLFIPPSRKTEKELRKKVKKGLDIFNGLW